MKEFEMLLLATPQLVAYDNGDGNSNDAFVPEHWAMESLIILEEEMVMSNLVHRDFNNEVQQWGDVVNTRRPRKFFSQRKTDQDCVEEQDAISDNVTVPLNQHHYTSFIIKDGEMSLSFKDLVRIYLRPAMQSVARGVDRSVIGQVHRFIDQPSVGRLGGLSSANARQQIIDARQKLKSQNVPLTDLRLVMSPESEAAFLGTDLFVASDKADTDAALRKAQLGELFGFGLFCAQNTPCADKASTDFATGDVTGALAAGTPPASLAVTLTGYEAQVGDWATIAGDDQPRYITAATVGAGDTTAITLDAANKFATLAGAELTVYQSVQSTAAYAAGYQKEVSVDGWTNPPLEGQMFATGSGATRRVYNIIESRVDPANGSNQLLLLDRPLETAIADNENVFPGPAGCFNLAFHKDALAFVNRPLALPKASHGVDASVQTMNDLSIRVTMQYDSKCQGTRVTCDMLSGVALLDAEMACLFYG